MSETGVDNKRSLVMPPTAAMMWIAVAMLVFELIGGIFGHWEDSIKGALATRIQAHPAVMATVGGGEAEAEAELAAIPTEGSAEQQAAGLAEEAWGRLKFFHGHGFQMMLATFVMILLIANLSIRANAKAWLTWLGLLSMTMYNLGWFFAGILVPWKGLASAKNFGQWLFLLPFGILALVVWAIITFAWVREVAVTPKELDGPEQPAET